MIVCTANEWDLHLLAVNNDGDLGRRTEICNIDFECGQRLKRLELVSVVPNFIGASPLP